MKSRPKDDEALTYRGEIELARAKRAMRCAPCRSVVTDNPDMAVARCRLA